MILSYANQNINIPLSNIIPFMNLLSDGEISYKWDKLPLYKMFSPVFKLMELRQKYY